MTKSAVASTHHTFVLSHPVLCTWPHTLLRVNLLQNRLTGAHRHCLVFMDYLFSVIEWLKVVALNGESLH